MKEIFMLRNIRTMSVAAALLFAAVAMAQAPADAPAGSTGQCKDGSYWTGPTKKGACRGHKGVQAWYGSADTGASGGAVTAAAPPTAAAATPAPVAAPTPAPAVKASSAPPATPAAGGGPGLVWVNTSSKVYHCPSDKWYGKTKNGSYMSEADAIAKGNHADHGKACKQ
jgi:hypothetical protein